MIQLKVERCVLAICQYVSQVHNLRECLSKEYNYPESKIFIYTGRNEEKFLRLDISSGEILIATNIAGRGTDLFVNKTAKSNGGLHVCITFLPSHSRVELQNVGRTARKGEKGSAQLLLYDSNGATIEDLKKSRDKREKESLMKAQNDINDIKLQDTIFTRFCNFLGTLFPEMSKIHNKMEYIQLEDAYELEKETKLSDESLIEAFNKHTTELLAKELALLEKDSVSQVFSILSTVQVSGISSKNKFLFLKECSKSRGTSFLSL